VVGYASDVERYLAAADLAVTKPGGLTISESLALGCPLLLTRPIPGQEEGNTRVLRTAGAALSATEPREVTLRIEQIFGDPRRLTALRSAARSLGRPHAAASIASAIQQEYLTQAAA
jgi:processive 1,2-diacylglycerol beta-glucosyltransferase